jgi:hypothetical protein
VNLPTFEEAQERVRNGCATHLETFIFNWEPRAEHACTFRSQLSVILGESASATVEQMKPECVEHNEYMDRMMDSLLSRFWNPETKQYEKRP